MTALCRSERTYLHLCHAFRQAKLADFGLHKRVRKMTSSGALVAWNQETTYHGADYDKSFYGGKLYLVKSAMSIASSMHDDDSVRNGSMHGSSMHGGSLHGGGSWHRAGPAGAALGTVNDSAYGALSATAGAAVDASVNGGNGVQPGGRAPVGSGRPPLPYRVSSASGGLSDAANGAQKLDVAAGTGGPTGANGVLKGGVQCSDSAGSIAAADSSMPADKDKQQQQHLQHELLQGAVRAKSQGLLEKQDFVTRVLSVPSNSTALQKVGCNGLYQGEDMDSALCRTWQGVFLLNSTLCVVWSYCQRTYGATCIFGQPAPACCNAVPAAQCQGSMHEGDKEVARTLAAVQALEGSVRAGSAFYQQAQQQQYQQLQPSQPPQQQQQVSPGVSSSGRKVPRSGMRLGRQQSELCPQLLKQLQSCQNNSQKFIEATQKVGSVMYMAPEVLTGDHTTATLKYCLTLGPLLYLAQLLSACWLCKAFLADFVWLQASLSPVQPAQSSNCAMHCC